MSEQEVELVTQEAPAPDVVVAYALENVQAGELGLFRAEHGRLVRARAHRDLVVAERVELVSAGG